MPRTDASALRLGILSRRHLRDVVEIERSGVPPYWSRSDFIGMMANESVYAHVVEMKEGNRAIGFTVYRTSRKRIQLHNIGVHPEFRRSGIGLRLIDGIHARFPRVPLYCSTMEENLSCQLFLRAAGFLCTSIIENPPVIGDDGVEYVMGNSYFFEKANFTPLVVDK